MKKLTALVLVLMMMLGTACLAAQWPEGRSAAQPYAGLPEVDLTQSPGYIVLFPSPKWPAELFCDLLAIYLPREDVQMGKGCFYLYENVEGEKDPVLVCQLNFEEEGVASIRPMTEGELQYLMWGSGVCVEVHLPKSLEFGTGAHDYFVTTDEGCFVMNDGKIPSLAIASHEAWMPTIGGDYGISGLCYAEPPEIAGPESSEPVVIEVEHVEGAEVPAEATPEPTAAPTPEPKPEEDVELTIHTVPQVGDMISLEIVLGGDAKTAVIHSDNDSVYFDDIEFTETTKVTGTVLRADLHWGVVFLDAEGNVLSSLTVAK